MKRLICLTVWLVFLAWSTALSQKFTPAPVVTIIGGSTVIQDSLTAKVTRKDSNNVGAYVTFNRMTDSIATYWHRKDTSITTGVKGVVTSTMANATFLKNADSTTLKAGLLKNADSTTLKAGLLKNADSTTLKAGLLKNADSTTLKAGLLKNADSTTIKNQLLILTHVYAAIDSFTTSGQTKDITVAGSVVGGAVIVTPYYPEYSAIADTGQQYSGFVKSGGGTIEIVRTKLVPASTIKSGGIFSYIYIKPR